MKIGDKVWIFDNSIRVYEDENGNRSHGTNFRAKFVERYIVGETRVSWIIGYSPGTSPDIGMKLKKKDRTFFISEEEVKQACWVHEHRYKIRNKLDFCKDYEKIKQIADILDYQE
ncbi:hypothetical protein [Bacillus sp. NPDC094106]|uniref:hypothetical protein n=1 Tax=Bacillus sp. NPDC094106 TaxID=3363949 RepID=UPI00380109B9